MANHPPQLPHTEIVLRPYRMNVLPHPADPNGKLLVFQMPDGVAYTVAIEEKALLWLKAELNGGLIIASAPIADPSANGGRRP